MDKSASEEPVAAVNASREPSGKKFKKKVVCVNRIIKSRSKSSDTKQKADKEAAPKKIMPRVVEPDVGQLDELNVPCSSRRVSNVPQPQQRSLAKSKSKHNTNTDATTKVTFLNNAALTSDQLKFLQSESIFLLKKRSVRFIKALFFCRLCEHHINTFERTITHCKEKQHRLFKKERQFVESLSLIPEPVETHSDFLNAMLRKIADRHRLTVDFETWFENVQMCLSHIARNCVLDDQDCFVRMYGSCATGFALKDDTNVNLELVYPESKIDQSTALIRFTNAIYQTSGLVRDATHDFGCRWPFVSFKFLDRATFGPLRCVLSVRNSDAFLVAEFLRTLNNAFPQLGGIAVVWRLWAKLCKLDNFRDGCLPAYAFDLMLVHYLQQRQPPLLPVIHSRDRKASASDEPNAEKFVNYERDVGKVAASLDHSTWNFGQIFVGMLRYYALSDDRQSLVINVRRKEPLTTDAKDWSCRRLAIEDPFIPGKNLAHLSNEMYAYLMRCLRQSYQYFAIPQTRSGPAFRLRENRPVDDDSSAARRPFVGERLSGGQLLARAAPPPLRYEDRVAATTGGGGDADARPIDSANGVESPTRAKRKAPRNDQSVADDRRVSTPSAQSSRATLETPRPYNCAEMLSLGRRYYLANRRCPNKRLPGNGVICAIPRGGRDRKKVEAHLTWLLLSNELPAAPADDPHFSIIKRFLDWSTDHGLTINAFEKTDFRAARDGNAVSEPFVSNDAIEASDEKVVVQATHLHTSICAEKEENHLKNGLIFERSIGQQPEEIVSVAYDDKPRGSAELLSVDEEEYSRVIDGILSVALCDQDQTPAATASQAPLDRDDDSDDLEQLAAVDRGEEMAEDGAVLTTTNSSAAVDDKALEPTIDDAQFWRKRQFEIADGLSLADFHFSFDPARFLNGVQKPRVRCATCDVWGHQSTYCPDPLRALGPPRPLRPVTDNFKAMQDYLILNVLRCYGISSYRQVCQDAFKEQLEKLLRGHLAPDVRLHLFGSSRNGYGFSVSDLDLCLTFDSFKSAQDLNCKKIINDIAKILSRDERFTSVLPVTRAKVPIVRFFYGPIGLEGDISLYNILALRNTQLMYCYSTIDPRAKALGHAVKVFVKYMDVGDASKGSLSSYAYIVMMTHFLQQRKPPVLPVLQEIGPKKSCVVDGWETYFYDDLKSLESRWKTSNTERLSELWIGFLRYYTEIFDFRNDVVQIRRSVPPQMTKLEKSWTDKPLAIEDPFELCHNLASGISRKMFVYIIRVFRKAREVFGDECSEFDVSRRLGVKTIPYNELERYFFEVALKMDEQPPKDRVCRRCERVGHFAENCPSRGAARMASSSDSSDQSDQSPAPTRPI